MGKSINKNSKNNSSRRKSIKKRRFRQKNQTKKGGGCTGELIILSNSDESYTTVRYYETSPTPGGVAIVGELPNFTVAHRIKKDMEDNLGSTQICVDIGGEEKQVWVGNRHTVLVQLGQTSVSRGILQEIPSIKKAYKSALEQNHQDNDAILTKHMASLPPQPPILNLYDIDYDNWIKVDKQATGYRPNTMHTHHFQDLGANLLRSLHTNIKEIPYPPTTSNDKTRTGVADATESRDNLQGMMKSNDITRLQLEQMYNSAVQAAKTYADNAKTKSFNSTNFPIVDSWEKIDAEIRKQMNRILRL
jgi:hypothetical protein